MLTQKHSCILHQAYRDVLDRLKSAAGLHEDAMLDVRGNHDAFDIPDRYSSNSSNTQSRSMTMTTGKHSHAASSHDTNNVCFVLATTLMKCTVGVTQGGVPICWDVG